MKKVSYVLGIATMCLSLASCGIGSSNTEQPSYKVVEQEIEITKPVYVDNEVIVEVEKPIYIEKEVEVEIEKPIYVEVEKEVEVEVEKKVYVEKEVIVEVEKPVYVEVEKEYATYVKTEYVEVEKIVEKPIYVEKQVVNLDTLNGIEVKQLGENLYEYDISASNYASAKTEIEKLFITSNVITGVGSGFVSGMLTSKSGIVIRDLTFVSSQAMTLPTIFTNNFELISEDLEQGTFNVMTNALPKKEYTNILEEDVNIKFNTVYEENSSFVKYAGPMYIRVVFSLREPINNGTFNDNEGWGEIHS